MTPNSIFRRSPFHVVAAVATLLVLLTACEKNDASAGQTKLNDVAQQAGQKLDQAASYVGQQVNNASTATQQSLDSASKPSG